MPLTCALPVPHPYRLAAAPTRAAGAGSEARCEGDCTPPRSKRRVHLRASVPASRPARAAGPGATRRPPHAKHDEHRRLLRKAHRRANDHGTKEADQSGDARAQGFRGVSTAPAPTFGILAWRPTGRARAAGGPVVRLRTPSHCRLMLADAEPPRP